MRVVRAAAFQAAVLAVWVVARPALAQDVVCADAAHERARQLVLMGMYGQAGELLAGAANGTAPRLRTDLSPRQAAGAAWVCDETLSPLPAPGTRISTLPQSTAGAPARPPAFEPFIAFSLTARGVVGTGRRAGGVSGEITVDGFLNEIVAIGAELWPVYSFVADGIAGGWSGVGGLAHGTVYIPGWGIGFGVGAGAATMAQTGAPAVALLAGRVALGRPFDRTYLTLTWVFGAGDAANGVESIGPRARVQYMFGTDFGIVLRAGWTPFVGSNRAEGGVRFVIDDGSGVPHLALMALVGWQEQSFLARCMFGPCANRTTIEGVTASVTVQYRP